MSILTRDPKPDPTVLYRCAMGYVNDTGPHVQGDVLRGSHQAVQSAPLFWILADLDTEEELAEFHRRFGPDTVRGR